MYIRVYLHSGSVMMGFSATVWDTRTTRNCFNDAQADLQCERPGTHIQDSGCVFRRRAGTWGYGTHSEIADPQKHDSPAHHGSGAPWLCGKISEERKVPVGRKISATGDARPQQFGPGEDRNPSSGAFSKAVGRDRAPGGFATGRSDFALL